MNRDLPDFDTADSQDSLVQKLNQMVFYFNRVLKSLSLTKNFGSSTIVLSFAAGETKTISHLLGVRPKYRIILRQEGNGVLSDIPSSWDDTVAVITNNGAVSVNATIMFLKE
jgi:hypothetical protein